LSNCGIEGVPAAFAATPGRDGAVKVRLVATLTSTRTFSCLYVVNVRLVAHDESTRTLAQAAR
jgi:hypothetical protein